MITTRITISEGIREVQISRGVPRKNLSALGRARLPLQVDTMPTACPTTTRISHQYFPFHMHSLFVASILESRYGCKCDNCPCTFERQWDGDSPVPANRALQALCLSSFPFFTAPPTDTCKNKHECQGLRAQSLLLSLSRGIASVYQLPVETTCVGGVECDRTRTCA